MIVTNHPTEVHPARRRGQSTGNSGQMQEPGLSHKDVLNRGCPPLEADVAIPRHLIGGPASGARQLCYDDVFYRVIGIVIVLIEDEIARFLSHRENLELTPSQCADTRQHKGRSALAAEPEATLLGSPEHLGAQQRVSSAI